MINYEVTISGASVEGLSLLAVLAVDEVTKIAVSAVVAVVDVEGTSS